jgi:hypothetical protein
MGDPRESDAEHSLLVDVVTTDAAGNPLRTAPNRCRATPRRIYTMGGVVFDRSTGEQIVRRDLLAKERFRLRAIPETLRDAKEKVQ